MPIIKALVIGTLTILVGLALLLGALGAYAIDTLNHQGVSAIAPSDDAVTDIPPLLLNAYQAASATCPGLPWTVLAGIGKVESNHARFGGSQLTGDGDVTPPILGPLLDGSTPGTIAVPLPPGGSPWHSNPTWDRALGPMQFLTGTFRRYGIDANHDGTASPHNAIDAIHTTAAYLCGPDGRITDLRQAIYRYNHSDAYVDQVLAWAQRYTGAVTAIPIAGYAPPIPGLTAAASVLSHHDYPASDLPVPVGTPVAAMVAGTVTTASAGHGTYPADPSRCGNLIILAGSDSVTYTYCHLSAIQVTPGQQVTAGQQLGASGGQPGAPGAGNSTGPHLHLGLDGQGRSLCPQPVLLAIISGHPINPLAAPSTGCVTGQAQTDWTTWRAP